MLFLNVTQRLSKAAEAYVTKVISPPNWLFDPCWQRIALEYFTLLWSNLVFFSSINDTGGLSMIVCLRSCYRTLFGFMFRV